MASLAPGFLLPVVSCYLLKPQVAKFPSASLMSRHNRLLHVCLLIINVDIDQIPWNAACKCLRVEFGGNYPLFIKVYHNHLPNLNIAQSPTARAR